jgi:hypothetical protein
LVQPVKHWVLPLGQAWQLLPTQLNPLEQTVPQAPQFLLSTEVSVHTPLQRV